MGYRNDINKLIKSIDKNILNDKSINGIQYDIYPWHGYSAISLMTRADCELDVASWKYFECCKSTGEELSNEFDTYLELNDRHHFHCMLVKAASELLEADLSSFAVESPVSDLGLNKLFQVRVYDPDETFTFNYCEFIVANNTQKT
ncbi:hypothetical protein [Motilimonas pumila]|uniref:Uncharacterized protein n=1 Tax=Motilimonas pumila TaxID=2303987 RepID=A0A418YFN9_9GAMM|nr:hypothetical protein [Motilimonas pumila]RJG48206.1 hypothetical protein D1Z90_09065 [Motilimonas pumila]